MALIEAELMTYLLSKASVTALVGTRVFRVFVPQSNSGNAQSDVGKLPRIVLQRVTGGRSYFIGGGDGLPMPTIQLSCQALTYGAAKAIADALRMVLDGFSGTMGSTYVGVCVQDNETDIYEPPDDARDQGVHQCVLDYRIAYTETAPTL